MLPPGGSAVTSTWSASAMPPGIATEPERTTNSARVGRFSSDRTILEYSRDIWRCEAQPVLLEPSAVAITR